MPKKILRYNDFVYEKIPGDFLNMLLNPVINEKSDNRIPSMVSRILKNLSDDLRFNVGIVFTFGTGITAMYPIVENLIKNGNLSIDPTPQNIVLLSLTALGITYLEETGNKVGNHEVKCSCGKKPACKSCHGTGIVESEFNRSDAQNLLAELKLRGAGNGSVKKFVACFKAIGVFLKKIIKSSQYVINGLMDMLTYAAISIPVMNVIASFVGNYNMTLDNLAGNLTSIGVGITSLLSKQGINYLFDKIKSVLKIKGGFGVDDSVMKNLDIIDIIDSDIRGGEQLTMFDPNTYDQYTD